MKQPQLPHARYVFVDFETNGLNPHTTDILEVGLVICDSGLLELERIDSLIHFDGELDPEAQAVHGISAEELRSAPGDGLTVDAIALAIERHRLPGCRTYLVSDHLVFETVLMHRLMGWGLFHDLFHHAGIDAGTLFHLHGLEPKLVHRALPDAVAVMETMRVWAQMVDARLILEDGR